MSPIASLVLIAAVMFTVLGLISLLAHIYNLNNIKNKTVGDGQHGTAAGQEKRKSIKPTSISRLHRSCGERAKICPKHKALLSAVILPESRFHSARKRMIPHRQPPLWMAPMYTH